MSRLSPELIAASLTDAQRDIVFWGPTNFAESDAIPKELFDEDFTRDPETGDETYFWEETALGRRVREILSAQKQKV